MKQLISIFFSMLILACGGQVVPPTLVYKNTFDSPDALNDWVMEGPGIARIENGKLLIYSKWEPDLEAISNQVALIEPGGEQYSSYIEQWVKEREPENLPKYQSSDKRGNEKKSAFAGGPIQFWNKHVHPENFLIRLKFQAASPYPLHMVTFCARGMNGEDVLDSKLAPRFGLPAQYMYGDIRNYRISYWAGLRGTCNMRRAPGRKLIATESGDVPRDALEKEVQLEIFRWKGRVVFKCDGQTLVDWTDDKPFGDGFFSLRLMAAAKGLYDDYEVYELREDPFSQGGAGTPAEGLRFN